MDKIFSLINKLEAEGNYEEALRHLDIAFEEKLGSFRIRNDMGRIYNKMRNFEDALNCFDSVLVMDDSNQEYLLGKGISCIGLNRFGEAYEIFDKITELNKFNANAWYYKSILARFLGDSNAKKYFKNFKRYDKEDEKCRLERSYYNFGFYFDKYEYELRGFQFKGCNGADLLEDFENELKSLNFDAEVYSEIVRLVPLDELFKKITELNGSKFGKDTEEIIRNEFKKQGLTDEDVDDLFKIDTLENLKEEVVSLCDENPFPDSEKYMDFNLFEYLSKYNVRRPKLLEKEEWKMFARGNISFDEGKIEDAIEYYDNGLKYNQDNLLLKLVKNYAIYKLGGDGND